MGFKYKNFIKNFPPKGNHDFPSELKISSYKNHLPQGLLELWEKYGFGLYGEGCIQIVDPDIYRENLWGWLLRDEADMERLPIGITAFGGIFYYRLLSDDGDEDISFLNPHTSEGWDLAWSADDFFNEWCCDKDSLSDVIDFDMYEGAVSKLGELSAGQIYYYVPALRLGGVESLGALNKGDAIVHFDMLLELALSKN